MNQTSKDSLREAGPSAPPPGGGGTESTDGTVPIQGFERVDADREASQNWRPVSDRKIRVGIAGYGVCRFGAAFHFQDHPNVGEFHRSLLHGHAQQNRSPQAGEQSIRQSVWHRNRVVPHERRGNGAHGGELGYAGCGGRKGPDSGGERVILRHVPERPKRRCSADHHPSAASSRS